MSKYTTNPSRGFFYVYVLIRPDGRPFYVGKGTGPRVDQHEQEARRGCDCKKCRIIQKIWRAGGRVVKSIVFETLKEAEALQYEADLIDKLWGTIANISRGERKWLGKRISGAHRAGDYNVQEWRQHWSRCGLSPKEQRRLLDREMRQQLDRLRHQRQHWHQLRLTPARVGELDRQIEEILLFLNPGELRQRTLDDAITDDKSS